MGSKTFTVAIGKKPKILGLQYGNFWVATGITFICGLFFFFSAFSLNSMTTCIVIAVFYLLIIIGFYVHQNRYNGNMDAIRNQIDHIRPRMSDFLDNT